MIGNINYHLNQSKGYNQYFKILSNEREVLLYHVYKHS